MILFAELKPGAERDALSSIAPFLASPPRLFETAEPPAPSTSNPVLAVQVADAIAPRANQPMRSEVLKALYAGYDTLLSQQGDADPAFRNGTAALSRALRPFTAIASPLDILFVRERRLVPTGVYKGKYEGTAYRPTTLGEAVGQVLKERGVI